MHGPATRDAWVSYFVLIDGALSSVAFDASLRERAPVPGLPVLTRLSFPVTGNDDFFFTPEEGEGIERVIAKLGRLTARPPGLLGFLRDTDPPVLAGRVSRRGECQAYLYGSRPLSKGLLVEVERAVPGVAWDAHQGADPTWSYYLQNLHPGDVLGVLLAGRAEYEERARAGDDLAAPRAVEHTLRFPDAAGREAFLTELRAMEEGELDPFEDDAAAERPFGVTVTVEHDVTRSVLEPYVLGLSARATNHGGVYEGWGAEVVAQAR